MIFWKYEEYMLEIIIVLALRVYEKFSVNKDFKGLL